MTSIPPWKKRLPMYATYARIVAAGIMIPLIWWPDPWARGTSAVIFVLASLTDWLDGYWARRYQSVSAMGQFMDPIADKVLVMTALILLLDQKQVDPLMVVFLLSRDLFISGLRSAAAAENMIIAAKPSGKWKTALQMIAIPCLLWRDPVLGLPVHELGYYGMWFSVGLSLASGIEYTCGYIRSRHSRP